MWLFLLLFTSTISKFRVAATPKPLQEVFQWKQVEFDWPDPQVREAAIKNGDYIPANNLPLGIDMWQDKLFVTIPRWKSGVAATLNYVPIKSATKSPTLIPYPDWKANRLLKDNEKPDDNHIISTFRVKVDPCDRLWVMDTGIDQMHNNRIQISPPALLVFDLKTDQLLRRYVLKPTDFRNDTFIANIAIDVDPESCENAYAYIPDVGAFGLIVYSWPENDSWRIKHNYFYLDPLSGNFNVGGINFQWPDGIFGVALGAKINNTKYRTLYFHSLSSTKEFSVSTEILQNKHLALDPQSYHSFKFEGDRGDLTQSSTSVFDEKSNVLFLTQLNRDGFACWNSNKPLIPDNVILVVQDNEELIFTNELRIDPDRNLWVFADKMPVFLFKGLDLSQINFRIFKGKIDEIIKDSPCVV